MSARSHPDLERVPLAPRQELPLGPAQVDPLATYDALGRKQPKRIGFMEVCRMFPWLLRGFTGMVPAEMMALDGDEVTVPCVCKATATLRENTVLDCPGDCGRFFWFIAGDVRVYTKPPLGPGVCPPDNNI